MVAHARIWIWMQRYALSLSKHEAWVLPELDQGLRELLDRTIFDAWPSVDANGSSLNPAMSFACFDVCRADASWCVTSYCCVSSNLCQLYSGIGEVLRFGRKFGERLRIAVS
jgi:hypothetical protein